MGTINICNRMCYYRVVRETFHRFKFSRNASILNSCNIDRSICSSRFKQENYSSYLCQFHLWKVQHFSRGVQFCASFGTDTPTKNLKLRHDPNKFGDLSNDSSSELIYDEGDIIEDQYVTYPVSSKQQLRIKQYADIIKQHLQKLELTEAVDVLETRMIKEDRVKPNAYIYSLLISACGRLGETRKAFKLYNKMKERDLKIPGAVYTALFNACANSAYPHEGLKRAIHLQVQLVEKAVELNATHYNAMIKAYGRCGDLCRAFQVADLMIDKELQITEEAFNFLLQACISDSQAGFRHALLVWHKMLQRNIKPSIYSFNLLLRCVRDCAMGQYEEIDKSLQQLTLDYGGPSQVHIGDDTRQLVMEGNIDECQTLPETIPHKRRSVNSPWEFLPDLLSPTPRLGCDISSLDVSKPHERLLLLGGSQGFLRQMANYDVTPTIKTYTVLLDCIPPTIIAEKNLISKMRKDGIQIDIEFCNMLIKKRSFRFDYSSAQDVLKLIKQEKLQPDIVTFGVLALACSNEQEARHLIRNMMQAGYRMNVEILGAMLKQGCIQHNFKYVTKVLYLAKEENIKPSPLFMENIQCLIASSRDILKRQKNGDEIPASLDMKSFRKEFTTFMYKYEAWQKEMNETYNKFHSRSYVPKQK